MTIKKLIENIKHLNKKASLLNKSIPNKNPTKFANNPFKEVKQGNTFVWVDKN
ncbi:hypothetical protein IKA15_05275 [bacterium]|nr:hypothetical protein [bacterium]